MFFLLLLLFIGLPIVEVTLLFKITESIGGWNTIGIVLLTGFLGAHYAKQEGNRVWTRVRKDLRFGVLPADSLLDGLLIFVGGFLLITPGFITDFLGLSFVFGPTRRGMLRWAKRLLEKAVRSGKIRVQTYSSTPYGTSYHSYQGPEEREVFEAQIIDLQQKKEERDAQPKP
tara:strand:+ start:5554 stop:6069 length:516 start_codon:yes stop_codon:yes gene_type:complete